MEYSIVVNNNKVDFFSLKQVVIGLLMMSLKQMKFSSVETIKENIMSVCSMTAEFCDLCRNDTNKSECTSVKRKVNMISKYIHSKKTVEEIKEMVYNSVLAIEGMGLLPGFQYGSKVHKRDRPCGNAEKDSAVL